MGLCAPPLRLLLALVTILGPRIAAADVPPPRPSLLESLSPVERTKVVMTLLGLTLLGLTLLAMIWWAGRFVRRVVRKPLKPIPLREHAWAEKPIVPQPGSPPPPPSEPL